MPWFLTLQGSPSKTGQSLNYELQESADIEQLAEELASPTSLDRGVAVPAFFGNRRPVTVYVRPAAWGAWAFYELTEDERQKMMTANANAVTQAAQQQRARQQAQAQQVQAQQQRARQKPQQGPSVVTLPGFDPNKPQQ